MKRAFLTFLLFCLLPFAEAQAATGEQAERHAAVRLIPERTTVAPGEPFFVALEVTPDPGWHTYWTNPGDSGEAMRVRWDLPAGFEAGDMKWPTPEKILIGPLASYGYEEKMTVLQEMQAPWDLPTGPLTLRATIDILVCAEICIPETGTYEVVLNGPGDPQDNAGTINDAYNRLPADFDRDVTFAEEDGALVLRFDHMRGLLRLNAAPDSRYDFIPDDWGIVADAAETAAVMTDTDQTVFLRQKRGDRSLDSFEKVTGLFAYTDKLGLRQSFRFFALPDPAWKKVETLPAPKMPAPPPEQTRPLAQIVLFALLGGLILNLMPCVFPVLSLKALKLCRMGSEELAHARRHGLLYAAGILASFAVFAALLLSFQAAGAGIGWGFHLQNPGFVAFLTYLLFAIGLNLAGFFEVTVSIGGRSLTQEHGYAASFLTGVLAAVVATPCTAPFMGVAMGYALAQPPAVAMTVFLALGFGLALPYLALSFVPALQKILPKPGAWMQTLRRILSVPMLLSTAWLAWVFWQQTGNTGLVLIAAGMALMALAISFLKSGKNALKALSVVLLLLSLMPLGMKPVTAPPVEKDGWTPYAAESFARLEAGDDPLFVNMTAAWCITCKINERVALETPPARRALADRHVILIKGDWTNYNPEITSYLESFARDGVPLYVYYGPRTEGQRPAPVVLPQILTPSLIERTISP